MEPLPKPIGAPVIPLARRHRRGIARSIASSIILNGLIHIRASRILLTAAAVSGAVTLRRVVVVLAAVGIAHAPVVLRRAGVGAGVAGLAVAVHGALTEVLLVEELEGVVGALRGLVVAADAGELVPADGFAAAPGGWGSAEAGGSRGWSVRC